MTDTTEVERHPLFGTDVVRASDYDALAAKLAEVEADVREQRDLRNHQCKLKLEAMARIEELRAKLAEAKKLQDAQKLFNYYAVEIVTYGATIFRMQNLENAWVNLKTQAEIVELKARIQTGEKE